MTTGRTIAVLTVTLAALVAVPACQTHKVTRTDPENVLDYQSSFDEDDAREVSNALVADVLSRPWIDRWEAANEKPPVVIVGDLRNDTSDYIDSRLLTKTLEKELLNTGRVTIVASADERGQIRAEREAGQDWSRPDTVKRMAWELGADLMLIGWIGEDVEMTPNRRKTIQYYQVSLELVDVESNAKVWIGTHDIEKRETR